MRRQLPLVLLLLIGLFPTGEASPLHAQSGSTSGSQPQWRAPQWMGDAAFLSLNALLGGVSAGVLQRVRGGSFADGFTRGALGGGVHYAGMRVAAQHFGGAGLLGRQISATGISVIRNASEARPALEQLFFPVGPLHLYVEHSGEPMVRLKINLAALTTVVAAALQPELEWDAAGSLSAGAAVFRAPGRAVINRGEVVNGVMRNGTIVLSDLRRPEFAARVFAHERVHVLQRDWRFHVWSDPAEAWMLRRLPGGRALYHYIDIDFAASWLQAALYDALDVELENRLHEIEADFLENR